MAATCAATAFVKPTVAAVSAACPYHQYESATGCNLLKTCRKGTFQSVPPLPVDGPYTSDRICTAMTEECKPGQVETLSELTYWSEADDDYYSMPMYFSDRKCAAVTTCDATAQFELNPPTMHRRKDFYVEDRECADAVVCKPTEYEIVPLGASSDRRCAARTKCCDDTETCPQRDWATARYDRCSWCAACLARRACRGMLGRRCREGTVPAISN